MDAGPLQWDSGTLPGFIYRDLTGSGTTELPFIFPIPAEMADNDNGNGSNEGLLSVSTQENVTGNKRKYLTEFSSDCPTDVSSLSLTEFPRYELLREKLFNTLRDIGSLEVCSDQLKMEKEIGDLQLVGWDDPIARQLEELLANNLFATFRSAVRKIIECGYTEEVAECAVLTRGICHGIQDVVSNIVNNALAFLSCKKEADTQRYNGFEDLQSLVEYTLLEMICVLREVKPFLTVTEAMWCLLICDLNLSHACAVEEDHLKDFCGREVSGKSSSDTELPKLKLEASQTSPSNTKPHNSLPSTIYLQNSESKNPAAGSVPQRPNLKDPRVRETIATKENVVPGLEHGGKVLGVSGKHAQIMSQTTVTEEKSCGGRKGCLCNSKRDMPRRKNFHFEKSYKGHISKGAFKAKLNSWGNMVIDKTKYPSDSSSVITKNISSEMSTGGAKSSLVNGKHYLPSNAPSISPATVTPATLPKKETVSALPATKTEFVESVPAQTKSTQKAKLGNNGSSKAEDYYAAIPYDNCLGKYVPQDEKDEAILMLVCQMQARKKEVQGWIDWANEKVMQAARRLGKDQAELKTLRQEKVETENFEKEKQILEEKNMKRLSEIEYALCNAATQIHMANSTVRKLETEQSVLKKEMEAATQQSVGSAANLQEGLLREQEVLKKAQSSEMHKALLQEEFTTDKHILAELQQQVEKSKVLHDQIQALWRQDEKEKLKILMQASLLRRNREQLEALGKAEENRIKQNAENEMQRYKQDIKKLENEISEMRLESESFKIAALRRSIDVSYGSSLTVNMSSPAIQGNPYPKVPRRLAVFQDNFGAGSVKPERECVMCLTDEMSVVFLPCSHQVLCAKCNVLHEKQGMNDCPSCRTIIQRRIQVRFH